MINWPSEWPTIQRIAAEYRVDPFFVAAVRAAENGPDSCPYGVLSEEAPSYELQVRACCATVRNQLASWSSNPLSMRESGAVRALVYRDGFIAPFGRHWAPNQARNDPGHLNENWIPNVERLYGDFVVSGGPR